MKTLRRGIENAGDRLLGVLLPTADAGACCINVGQRCYCRNGYWYAYNCNCVCEKTANPC